MIAFSLFKKDNVMVNSNMVSAAIPGRVFMSPFSLTFPLETFGSKEVNVLETSVGKLWYVPLFDMRLPKLAVL